MTSRTGPPRRTRFVGRLVGLMLCALPSAGAGERMPEREKPELVEPGETALLRAKKGMRYFLRVPPSYEPKRGARLIVFLHGSNMKGLDYLESFKARGWAKDDILCCPNGERGDDPYGRNNFSFGSAPYVAEVTRDVQAGFNVTRTYIGGHSQGGFVTFSAVMHYPELYQGAFPVSADCWMQNEPHLWQTKPDVLEKQKEIAIAVIHGKKDGVVSFSQGKHAYDVFVVMGYPRVRLLAPEAVGHQFMLLPVGDALDWLDAMTGADPARGLELAATWAREKEWGWVQQAAQAVIDHPRVPSSLERRARNARKLVEKAAGAEVRKMAALMEKAPSRAWLPAWYEFRRRFGETRSGAKLVERYESLRKEQRELGARLFEKARGLFRDEKKDEGKAVLREILEKAPASYEAYYALEWLGEE